MENSLFIQLSHNNMLYQYFSMIDTSNKSKQIGWGETCFYLFYVILQLYDVNILWFLICFMAPFSLYQVKPSVKHLLDTWLGIGANWYHKSVWCTLMSNRVTWGKTPISEFFSNMTEQTYFLITLDIFVPSECLISVLKLKYLAKIPINQVWLNLHPFSCNLGNTCKVIISFFVTDTGICNDFT